METALTTEEKIKQAARKVFLEKGFDGTTTRDIAREAGLNVALMNYYFRSKQKLFDSVFEEMLHLYFESIKTVLSQPIPLKEKITALIEHDFQKFGQNPDLAIFVLSELHRDSERFHKIIFDAQARPMELFDEQLQQAHQEGLIRPISAIHLMSLMSANIQFMFVGKCTHKQVWERTEKEFKTFTQEHKQLVCDMIIGYLFKEC